jgi:hypothetical protein
MAAKVLLDPFGITILEAASRVAAHEQQRLASVKIEAALEAFKQAKEDKSDKHRQAINQMATHLLEKFRGVEIADIKGIDVGKWMDEKISGPTSFNGRLRLMKNFWRWCAHPARGWCKPEILDDTGCIAPRGAKGSCPNKPHRNYGDELALKRMEDGNGFTAALTLSVTPVGGFAASAKGVATRQASECYRLLIWQDFTISDQRQSRLTHSGSVPSSFACVSRIFSLRCGSLLESSKSSSSSRPVAAWGPK